MLILHYFAHNCTLPDHRSYRRFLQLELMRTEGHGRIEIEAMTRSKD